MAKNKKPSSRGTAMVVFGMHRSGTSILTRVLNAHGCALSSQLLGANPSNPSGHWESSVAIAINDQLLADLGRSWDDLRELPHDWMQRSEARAAKDKIRILLDGDFRSERLWAIKEPRMCRLAPLWIEAIAELGFEVKAVIAVRHPREVALSLLRRDGLPVAHGLMLWTHHLLEAEAATRDLPRVVVSHREISSNWRSAMERIGSGLGVDWPVSGDVAEKVLEGFISEDSININEAVSGPGNAGDQLPEICRALYEHALAVESGVHAWPQFVAVADEVRAVSRIYGPVVDELYRTIRITLERKQENETNLRQVGDLLPLVSAAAGRLDHYMLHADEKQGELMSRLDRMAEFESRIDQLKTELFTQSMERAQADRDFEEFRKWASRLEGELQSVRESLRVETARVLAGEVVAADLQAELQSASELLQAETARALVGEAAAADLQAELQSVNELLQAEMARALAIEKEILDLKNDLKLGNELLQVETERVLAKEQEILGLELELRAVAQRAGGLEERLRVANQRADGLGEELRVANGKTHYLEEDLRILRESWSMRLTHPLRYLGAMVRGLAGRSRRIADACKHLARRPGLYLQIAKKQPSHVLSLAHGFIARGGPKPVAPEPVRFDLRPASGAIVILTTRHCEYIARGIHDALARVGIASEIIFERPATGYADVPHFVICPQIFPVLPGFYVAFQMEQSVSSRWFTAEYLRTLENSFAIFDYSMTNISFLKDKGISLRQVYYLPVGPLPSLLPEMGQVEESDEYDVVFYGDANNDRRQAYLRELRKYFRVKVVSEVFGEELYRILAGAKLIVNIHYYAGALLETTRIWECLSLGKLVVSERSSDMDDHAELDGVVDFVDIDDIQAMVNRVGYWLESDSVRRQRIQANAHAIGTGLNRFDYFFYRFLLATDNISFEEFWREAGSKYELTSDRLCLNLPEYTDRSRDFAADNKYGFALLPGLRHSKGWLGCAMSYKYMIRLASEKGLQRVTICEDDVDFPADFSSAMTCVDDYLAGHMAGWDIFSGLMADLHEDAGVLGVDQFHGRSFVTTNRLISTVMNIYNGSVFETIVNWDESNRDVETNTIDRYLERNSQLRVVVTAPFLVGHKEDQHSTIWGFQNTQYADMIKKSSNLLQRKVDSFLQ